MQRYWPVILLAGAGIILPIAGVFILSAQGPAEPVAAPAVLSTMTAEPPPVVVGGRRFGIGRNRSCPNVADSGQ
ncbi:MAG: hypothetical protein R3C44_21865 [Chloroflexota bacterium]